MFCFCSDLAFKRGEIIILRKRIDSHWFEGECGGKKGVFPVTYVQVIYHLIIHFMRVLQVCRILYW